MTPPNEFVLDSSHAAGTTRIARSLVKRAAIAILVGVVTWIYATLYLRAAGPYFVAGDFTWHWRAADALIRGFSPYKVINTMPVYPFTGGYPYFLSTAAIMVPFGLMSPPAAMALFS